VVRTTAAVAPWPGSVFLCQQTDALMEGPAFTMNPSGVVRRARQHYCEARPFGVVGEAVAANFPERVALPLCARRNIGDWLYIVKDIDYSIYPIMTVCSKEDRRVAIRFRLRELLEARGLTQTEVQLRTGLAYSTINELVNNRSGRLDLNTLDAICAALDCGVGDVIEYVPNPRRPRR